ncbi:MAG TPA: histidine kinase dimerization/phospho-acceptor domain-containing protein, partial [Thermoanaerobaculia bacterium]|nr:histidine kinase dimerization/phospho-acceptor domain-containing protein [Thermoanaerobaculia bacterium]
MSHQLRWLIGVRLVVITSIALAYFLRQLSVAPEAPPHYGPIYSLAGWVYLASLFYLGFLRLLRGHEVAQAYLQFLGDLILVSALVYFFGATSSPFSILYFVVIIVASALLRRRAGVLVAVLSGFFYAATVFLAIHASATAQSEGSQTAGLVASPATITTATIYDLSVHLLSFLAVALLASYLAESASRAERELEERTEDLADLQVIHQDVIESISSGIVTTDLEGRITSINRAGSEILGLRADELIALPIASTGLFNDKQWQAITERSSLGESLRDEVEYERDGEVHYVGFSLSQLESADGSLRGHILIFQDLTHWHGLQEELRIKDRMAAVGELAAGLAHEVGNPLAAISGSVQLLASNKAMADEPRKLLDILLKESQRLDRTIKGFLRFARPH